MAQQQSGQGNDNSLDFLWLIVLVVAGVGLLWYFGRNQIAMGIFTARYYEIIAIHSVLNIWNIFVSFLHIPLTINLDQLAQWKSQISAHTLDSNFITLQALSTGVGNFLRYPIILVLVILAFIVYSRNISMKFKTIFSMKRLRESEQADWPQITPIIKLNLVKEDINKGPWAMSMTPRIFCKHYNLLKESTNDGHITASVKRDAAYNIFVQQLGPLWTNTDALPIYSKALFGVFIACANADRESATKLLKQISISSSSSGKLDFTGAKELLDKHKNTKLALKVVSRHAYVLTVMASMLELARTDGVLASADFLWLKPVDRRLWYMLNSVGRQTAVAEVGGPFAHWLAERKLDRPLKVPMIEEAVNGLEVAMTEILYEPEEQ